MPPKNLQTYPSTIRPYTARHPDRGITHVCLACGLPATKTITPGTGVTILNSSAPAPFCPHCAPVIFSRVRSAVSLEDLLLSITRNFDEPTLKCLINSGTFGAETQAIREAFSFAAYSDLFADRAKDLLFPYSTKITSTLEEFKPHGRPKGAMDKPTSPRAKKSAERTKKKYDEILRNQETQKPFSYAGGYADRIKQLEGRKGGDGSDD